MRRLSLAIGALCAALLARPAQSSAAPIDLRRITAHEDRVVASVPEGGTVRLTLDPRLQRAAERILAAAAPHEGAIVASDVRTGKILAWATRGGRDYVATPFAPSASLFKLVTATALLEKGSVSPATRQCVSGGERSIRQEDLVPHPGGEERCVAFGKALGHSDNLVFARLALKHLSPTELRSTAGLLGFGGEVPIDVTTTPSRVDIPEDELGLARAAAGFWNGKLSPLGALFAMQTIANRGERIRLRVLASSEEDPVSSAGRAMSEETARTLRRMLEVTTRTGTCARVFRRADGSRILPMSIAAKTGTLVGSGPSRMYSWFAGFAPSNAPEIAVAVMLGNDLKWRAKANEAGRDLLMAHFGVSEPRGGAVARRSGAASRPRR